MREYDQDFRDYYKLRPKSQRKSSKSNIIIRSNPVGIGPLSNWDVSYYSHRKKNKFLL